MVLQKSVLLVDASVLTLDKQLTWAIVKRGSRAASDSLSILRDRVVRQRFGSASAECFGEPASQVLKECIEHVSAELCKWAESDSSLRWLWILRRLPERIFEGTLTTTLGYDTTLAEIISGHSAAKSEFSSNSRGNTQFSYPVDAALITRLARFCEGIRYLSNLHVCYRWIGKGGTIRFNKMKQPEVLIAPDLQFAVKAYDKRTAKAQQPLSRMGTVLTSSEDLPNGTCLLFVERIQTAELPTVMPGIKLQDTDAFGSAKTSARHFPTVLPLHRLENLACDPRSKLDILFNREAAALVYLLWCAPTLMNNHYAGFHSILASGYLMFTRFATPVRILSELFESTDAFIRKILLAARLQTPDDVLEVLESLCGKEWPLTAGPVFRKEGQVTCVDLVAASLRLNAALEFPAVQDRYVNARADHFEDEVQQAINATLWKPIQKAGELRRKTLFFEGSRVTDIDAIGTQGNTILLVSCKSKPYTAAHDAGDWRTIRNAALDISKDIRKWQHIVEHFQRHPRGDNYDFSMFPKLHGVVCTPQVIYVDKEILDIQAFPQLPMAASIDELRDWLEVTGRR